MSSPDASRHTWATDRVPGWTTQAAVLLTLAVAITGDRVRYIGEAVERDLAAYMAIAASMLEGKALYTDIWDHKPPGIHVTYEAFAAILGPTPVALFALGVAGALVTLLGCFWAGRIAGGWRGGIVAASVWAVINGDLLLQANQPNVEAFMNACLVWAFALVLEQGRRQSWPRDVVIGLLFFGASVYKPVAVAIAVGVVGAAVVAHAWGRSAVNRRLAIVRATRSILIAGGAAAAAWLVLLLIYNLQGRLPAFIEAVVDYNRDYAGDVGSNIIRGLIPSIDTIWPLLPYVPLGVAIGLTALASLRPAWSQDWLILIAYLVSAWIAVTVPGRLYPHYFQLMLPPIAVGAGWTLALTIERRSVMGAAVWTLLMAGPVVARANQIGVTADEAPVFKYGGYGYDCIETQAMADWINARVPREAHIYHWGPDPGVYFYAQRISPVPFVYNMPLTDGTPRSERYVDSVLKELRTHPPALVVARRMELDSTENPIEQWLTSEYQAIAGPPEVLRYVFLVPKHP